MGLNNNEGKLTFVNISNGRLYTKAKDQQPVYYTDIDGTIIKVDFAQEEYQGKQFEVAKFTMTDRGEKFVLQMRVDSGYFRGFCNSLRTGDPTMPINVTPSYKEKDGKPQTTCFIKQFGKTLKFSFTKDNMGDLPPVEQVTFKGQTQWDGSKQLEYWKKWLQSIQFTHEAVIEDERKELSTPSPAKTFTDDDMPQDGLPF